MTALFSPFQLGALSVPNRILMAPLTRCRADAGHMPSGLMAEYYAQRASAGLIIAEATMVMEGGSTYIAEPGIYSAAQVVGWQKITAAVHAAGGRIFLQLWHGGRTCHPLLNNGRQPVAPSPVAIMGAAHTPEGKKHHAIPLELRDDQLPDIVAGFKKAAENAKAAGFDGVEVHGANGYLLDEFLRDGTNQRTGRYGGSIENRARLLCEVIEAVSGVWGSQRVGLRISPLNSFNSMIDSDPVGLCAWLANRLNDFSLAYLHVMRGDFLRQQSGDVMTPIRAKYKGALIGNMAYTGDEAGQAIAEGKIDAVSFGTSFLSNPDLPVRIKAGAPLNPPKTAKFYTPGPEGYTDYPALNP